jgi:Ribosomal protein S6
MALYEHVVITRPDISPAQVDTFVEELSTFLKEKGAKVGKTEYWGLRSRSRNSARATTRSSTSMGRLMRFTNLNAASASPKT